MSAWWSCTKNLPGAWPGQVYRVKLGQLYPLQDAKDIPAVTLCQGPVPPQLDLRGWNWSSDWKKMPLQDNQSQGGIPILGVGIGWGGIRAPLLNAPASVSHPPLAPHHDPVLQMSGLVALWRTSTCKQDPANPGAGHGNMMHPHQPRTQKSRLGLTWKETWVMPLLWPRA